MIRNFHIGMLHFTSPFGDDLMDRLNSAEPFLVKSGEMIQFRAEHIAFSELSLDYKTPYELIIDRGSHVHDQAAGILNIFHFRGVHIINNPFSFHFFLKRKELGFAMLGDIGIPVPESVILPIHSSPDLDLEDFKYHRLVNWDEISYRIGFPCFVRPSFGYGPRAVHVVQDLNSLINHYAKCGDVALTVQASVPSDHEWHVRCLCIGKKILPIKYYYRFDGNPRYVYEKEFLPHSAEAKIRIFAKIINRLFNWEVNAIEFVIDRDGEPWVVEFYNPVPDSRRNILGEYLYEEYQSAMITLARDVVTRPQPCFIPKINPFAEIARMDICKRSKLELALDIAEHYYEPP